MSISAGANGASGAMLIQLWESRGVPPPTHQLGSLHHSQPLETETRNIVRWSVERTFGWLNRSRRLSKDFEALPETSEAWIRIAMIQLMIRRLAK